MAAPSNPADYTKEVRFAVVMYGGVSLAIYINGVAQELLRMVRSTAECEGAGENRNLLPAETIGSTERVYRKLSHLLADKNLLDEFRRYISPLNAGRNGASQSADPTKPTEGDPLELALSDPNRSVHTRFIVDILSGTSAGGINAIYLGKALSNDQQIDQLKNLWINEGDIALLLNDKRSVDGIHLRNQNPPQSLLNSRRMYLKLLKSLTDMGADPENSSPYVDELDLFITTTDIAGVPVPLRLLDGVVYERRHKNVFHFKYGNAAVLGEPHNDFRQALNPFLAFAARCTSSFPFAFEPMRLCDIDEVLDQFSEYRSNSLSKSDSETWQRFFQEELDPNTGNPIRPPRFAQRPFGDGGYLDNKPFGYAIDTLLHRQAEVPVDRKLIYIEPSPDHPERERSTLDKPNALQNVKAAVLDLPTYETIREDLQRVLDRNQLIERVNRIVSDIETDLNNYISEAIEQHLDGRQVAAQKQAMGTGGGGPPTETKMPTTTGTGSGTGEVSPAHGEINWYTADLVDVVNHYGRYFLPYRRLRIASVTDEIAALISRLAHFDEESDQFLAIRGFVRAWRKKLYDEYKTGKADFTVNAFLSDYDLSYRLRRISSIRERIDRLTLRDQKLLDELEKHSGSRQRIEKKLAEQSLDLESLGSKFPQLQLQQYAARLDEAVRSNAELQPILRFIKSELNEVFKLLRKRGRLLRSRQSQQSSLRGDAPPAAQDKEENPAEQAAQDEEEKGNPLLPLLANVGLTPADLHKILEGTGTEADEDQTVHEKRARALLNDKPTVETQLELTAEELKKQLGKVFEIARRKCNLLLDPDGVYMRHDKTQAYEPISDMGKKLLKQNPSILSSDAAVAVRGYLGYYYHNFDDYDQIRFPIFYEADVGESDTIEVIRISPEDAISLIDEREELKKAADPKKARRKLAGVAVHHFGAFLDRNWRQNDIMWGRLDGVERLIDGLLPGKANEHVRDALIKEAHLAILKEELKPQSLMAVKGVMSEALLRASTGMSIDAALDETLKPLKEDPTQAGIEEIVRGSLGDDQLVNFVSESYRFKRDLEPRSLLESMSRSTQIIGKMFEDMAEASGFESKRLTWIARMGRVFWGLVEVAIPNSLLNMLMFHWLKVLYFFEALVIVGAILLDAKETQNFGWKALALTLAVHITVVLLRDYMRLRGTWRRIFTVIVGLLLAVVLAVGAYRLYQLGPTGILRSVSDFFIGVWNRIPKL